MQTENWWEVRIGAQFAMMMALNFPPINFGKLSCHYTWNFKIQETGFWMTNFHESFIISQPCFFVCEIWMIPCACYCCVTQMSSNAKIKALFLPMLSPSWTMEAPLGSGCPWHSMFRSILHRVFPYTQWSEWCGRLVTWVCARLPHYGPCSILQNLLARFQKRSLGNTFLLWLKPWLPRGVTDLSNFDDVQCH